MAKKNPLQGSQRVGDVLRRQRMEVLNKGLREMAKVLDVAPAYLTALEKGQRTPSEELLIRMVKHYEINEATLRAGWSKPEEVVTEIASQDATTAAKVPEFLRSARKLSAGDWDTLIKNAKELSRKRIRG